MNQPLVHHHDTRLTINQRKTLDPTSWLTRSQLWFRIVQVLLQLSEPFITVPTVVGRHGRHGCRRLRCLGSDPSRRHESSTASAARIAVFEQLSGLDAELGAGCGAGSWVDFVCLVELGWVVWWSCLLGWLVAQLCKLWSFWLGGWVGWVGWVGWWVVCFVSLVVGAVGLGSVSRPTLKKDPYHDRCCALIMCRAANININHESMITNPNVFHVPLLVNCSHQRHTTTITDTDH